MGALRAIAEELKDVEWNVRALDAEIEKLTDALEPLLESTWEILGKTLGAFSGIASEIPEKRAALEKIMHEIDGHHSNLKALTNKEAELVSPASRSLPGSRRRETVIELKQNVRDLLSDLQFVAEVHTNIEGRLARLKGA